MTPYYTEPGIEIWHGDCREILPGLGKVDLVLTDPPYGVGLTHKQHKWFKQEGDGYTLMEDTPQFVKGVVVPIIEDCIERFGRVVVTPGTRCMFSYPPPTEIGGVFNSSGSGSGPWGFVCMTPVLYYGKDPYLQAGKGRRPNSWQQPPADFAEKVGHPCSKPPLMMSWLVNRSSLDGMTVLDPFMGSGSTLVAAKDLGRKAIGIEIEERYCEIAVKRLRQEVLPL